MKVASRMGINPIVIRTMGSLRCLPLETNRAPGGNEPGSSLGIVPWESIETYRASAFLLAGSLTVSSVILPVGVSAFTDWAWASGISLIGFAVIAVAVGLLGLYPQAHERVPRIAHAGALFAGIAAVAAIGLIVGIGIVLLAEVGFGTTVPQPTRVFATLALSMTGSFSLGFVSFGFAVKRTATISHHVGHLLVGGGSLLLLLTLVGIIGVVYSIDTPPWMLFPTVGVVTIDTLVIGYLLSTEVAH